MFILGFVIGYLVAIKFGAKYHYRKAFKNARLVFKDTLRKEASVQKRFEESIEKARECGVPEEEILHNLQEIDRYFTE